MTIAVQRTAALPTGTWTVDPVHSHVGFAVKHLGIATVRGQFDAFEGTLEVGEELAAAEAQGHVEAASVNTYNEARDEDLRSANFFDVERFPRIEFSSTAITPLDEDTFEIAGRLTLHGVTREISLRAEITGFEQDPYGNERVALEVTGELNRGDYGMTFNQALGSGNVLVSDKVKLQLDISAIKQA